MASPTNPGSTNLGVAPNVAGLLCYLPLCCVGVVFAIVAIIVEKQSRFVRFHAFQSLLLHVAWIVVAIVVWIVQIVAHLMLGFLGLLVSLLAFVVFLAGVAALILMMVKAYNNEEFELPVIGEMARKWAAGQS